MRTVHKYKLNFTRHQLLQLPDFFSLLDVQIQHGDIVLWALVDTEAPKSFRTFLIYGTGEPIDQAVLTYISTVQMAGGSYVWHVFIEPK